MSIRKAAEPFLTLNLFDQPASTVKAWQADLRAALAEPQPGLDTADKLVEDIISALLIRSDVSEPTRITVKKYAAAALQAAVDAAKEEQREEDARACDNTVGQAASRRLDHYMYAFNSGCEACAGAIRGTK